MTLSKNLRCVRIAFELGYRVEPDGRVTSHKGKSRKLHPHNNGFLRFSVWGEGRSRTPVFVHQLAAFQLFGDYGANVVIHLNGDRADNRLENITVGTRTESHMRMPRTLRTLYGVHAASKLRRFSEAEVAALRADRAAGASLKELCARYGIAKSTASYIVNRITYA